MSRPRAASLALSRRLSLALPRHPPPTYLHPVSLSEEEARDFIPRLQATWLSGDPDQYARICRDDVLLLQPLLPPMRGRAEVRERFRRLFRHFPDLRVRMTRWGLAEDAVLVEYQAAGTAGSRLLQWKGVDRIALEQGLIASRIAYFDWVPLGLQVLRSPRALPSAIRAGLWPRALRLDEQS